MSQQELLKKVVAELEALGLAYMLTGSLVSSLQGQPRATHDVDLVVALTQLTASDLAKRFAPPRFYVSDAAAREAVRHQKMFNLIDVESGDKVDFWMLTKSPFDRSRFSRRRREAVFDFDVWVSSPEDTILMKLKWARDSGGSEKQYLDALRVYEVQADSLDQAYLESWAADLSVASLWKRLLSEARPI